MLFPILQLLGGLALLSIGAEGFVRGAAAIALRLGISALVVGLTVVAFGTSCPELLVCVKAALEGQPGMAIGNAVGSNIFNLGAILGLVALVYPITCQARVIRREIPILVGVSLLVAGLIWFGGRPEGASIFEGQLVRPAGFLLIGLLGVYTIGAIVEARRETPKVKEEFRHEVTPIGESADAVQKTPIALSLVFLVVGCALLSYGADLFVQGAAKLGKMAGLSELVIGLTIVGAGTGLPELATSAVAAVRKETDIALGNIVGSCIFNLLGILGATVVVMPFATEAIVMQRDLPLMLFLTLLVIPLARSGFTINRLEGFGLLAIYLGYVTWLVLSAPA